MDRILSRRAWPLLAGAATTTADTLGKDSPALGRLHPFAPAFTTAELAWTDFTANRAVAAAEQAWLVQDGDTPKLVLVFDPGTISRLTIRPTGKKMNRGKAK